MHSLSAGEMVVGPKKVIIMLRALPPFGKASWLSCVVGDTWLWDLQVGLKD
jgi:hypothetical protein